MIQKLTCLESPWQDPYRNLAAESALLSHCAADEAILFLWQNDRTVVIGRNQNAWSECPVCRLAADGVRLARRFSGGGAVYHDLGNLNYTFLSHAQNCDVPKQFSVILQALQANGIEAATSGRNDILADGRKCSGSAFLERSGCCCHHGTLLVNTSLDCLAQYLTVSRQKLQSNGAASVRSRVVNLRELSPQLTVAALAQSLQSAFSRVYGLPVCTGQLPPEAEIAPVAARLCAQDWIYGRKLSFQDELERRFPWGAVQLQLQITGGCITDAAVYSDSLWPDLMLALPQQLQNCPYEKDAICMRLSGCPTEAPQARAILQDIIHWLQTEEF